MRLAYYPGCCYETSAKEYDISTRAVCRHLGIDLVEVPDWNCCGSTAAQSSSHMLGLSLAARNLALAEGTGLDVMAACAACYQRLAIAHSELKTDDKLRVKVNNLTGLAYRGDIRVLSVLDVIGHMQGHHLAPYIKRPLRELRAACYYGCLLVRPSSIMIDDPENPSTMDNIMDTAGLQVVDWPFKTECCGAGLAITNEDIVLELTNKILQVASDAGANCLVTACPLCHFNLDIRQRAIFKKLGVNYNLPVFYFTQLLGLAMGINDKELSLDTHFVDTGTILKPVS